MSNKAGSVREFRRGQIIAAGRTLVSEGGLEALTIAALERRLDFSRGVITYHFDNKEEIVEAVLMSAINEIDDATIAKMKASSTFEERVRAMIHGTVDGFIQHTEAAQILLSFWSRIGVDPRATEINAKLYADYRAAAAKLLGSHPKCGKNDAQALATLLVANVIGIVAQVYFEDGAINHRKAVDEAVSSVLARLAIAR